MSLFEVVATASTVFTCNKKSILFGTKKERKRVARDFTRSFCQFDSTNDRQGTLTGIATSAFWCEFVVLRFSSNNTILICGVGGEGGCLC